MTDVENERKSSEFIQSLDRGLAVIRAFSDERDLLSLADVAKITHLSRASVRRALLTLETLGYVGSRQNRFYLRPRVLDLGYAFLSSSTSIDITQDHLRRLSGRIGESVSACEYDDGDVVYVARAAAETIMPMRLGIGRRLPAFCTSTGRVLLSEFTPSQLDAYFATYAREKLSPATITDEHVLRDAIAEVREQGWSLNNQEVDLGARSIAAPVVGTDGRFVNAVNISVSTSRVSVDQLLEEYLPQLLAATSKISADIALLNRRKSYE
ncbi:IclR family transcriptional regulator C-terminal domain-containing protein [Plantibacter sp. ME-Dv--P-122b]|uniref:IclR family transcriptional regulator domain-containing protein n=1 Tax=Plantibacter sp. ME-Dv--P-122b TaxID=3040300 RepID=UPI00254A18B8|nr:IclR family transcriptional regulator C-terminal domain-containing protein [Plantibacter sp. ME-Dv--P-122b]